MAAVGRRAPDLGPRGSTYAAMATGALGGAAGLAGSLVELPVTITVMLHAIRSEAQAAGYDPDDPAVRLACLEVFSAGSPLRSDDGVNTAFLSARLTVAGGTLQKALAVVVPRLAAVFGQKLAAQAVPVLGAVSGAALNAAFLNYYREMARIRFRADAPVAGSWAGKGRQGLCRSPGLAGADGEVRPGTKIFRTKNLSAAQRVAAARLTASPASPSGRAGPSPPRRRGPCR